MCLECLAIFSNSSHLLVGFNYLLSIVLLFVSPSKLLLIFFLTHVILVSMFLFNCMRHSLNLAHSQAHRVVSATVASTFIHFLTYQFSFWAISPSLLMTSLPSCLRKYLVSLWAFPLPSSDSYQLSYWSATPVTKGPVLLVFVRPDVKQVLTWPGRKERGGRNRGERRRRRRDVYNIRHVDFSFDIVLCVSLIYCSYGNQLKWTGSQCTQELFL